MKTVSKPSCVIEGITYPSVTELQNQLMPSIIFRKCYLTGSLQQITPDIPKSNFFFHLGVEYRQIDPFSTCSQRKGTGHFSSASLSKRF